MPGELGRDQRCHRGMTIDQAVFLVGGLGSRLQDLTAAKPKPLLAKIARA